MTKIHAPARVSISAPDASAALLLEKRLVHLHPSAVGHGPSWSVHLEDSDDRLDEIEATVAHWLRDVGAPATEITVDGAHWMIQSQPGPAESPLGADYDAEPALEHEP